MNQLLEIIKLLNREIKGRQENLAPLFVIGGIYPIPNPFFLGRIALIDGVKDQIDIELLKDTVKTTVFDQEISQFTRIGYVSGIFKNENEFSEIAETMSVDEFFKALQQDVSEYYGV